MIDEYETCLVQTHVCVICDRCGRPGPRGDDERAARIYASSAGWRRKRFGHGIGLFDYEDWCPECWARESGNDDAD